MTLVDRMKDLIAAFDILAARLRGPLRGLALLGVSFQGLVTAGAFKLPAGTRWTNAVALGSIVLAYFTSRGPKETIALAAAKKMDEPPAPTP